MKLKYQLSAALLIIPALLVGSLAAKELSEPDEPTLLPVQSDRVKIYTELSWVPPRIVDTQQDCFGVDLGEFEPTCNLATRADVDAFFIQVDSWLNGLEKLLPDAPELRLLLRVQLEGHADGAPFPDGPQSVRVWNRLGQLKAIYPDFQLEPGSNNEALACTRMLELRDQLTPYFDELQPRLQRNSTSTESTWEYKCMMHQFVGSSYRGARFRAELEIEVPSDFRETVERQLRIAGINYATAAGGQLE